jgi:hypothetical protein
LNADKGGLLGISSKTEDLIQEDLSACIRLYLRSIQVFIPWCVKGNGTQINAEKAGFTQITSNTWFCLICGNQRMRSIRFYLRTIKVFGSWKGKGNGTQINAEKAGLPQAEKPD